MYWILNPALLSLSSPFRFWRVLHLKISTECFYEFGRKLLILSVFSHSPTLWSPLSLNRLEKYYNGCITALCAALATKTGCWPGKTYGEGSRLLCWRSSSVWSCSWWCHYDKDLPKTQQTIGKVLSLSCRNFPTLLKVASKTSYQFHFTNHIKFSAKDCPEEAFLIMKNFQVWLEKALNLSTTFLYFCQFYRIFLA